MTSGTDELRRLLDERGVEYVVDEEYGKKYPPEKRVTWSCDLAGEDMTVTARDYCIGICDDGSADYCLDLDFHEVFTPEQAIAATLGATDARQTQEESSETCHDVWDVELTGRLRFQCSECGAVSLEITPRFCPACGRKVVEPTTNGVDAEVEQ